MTNQHNYKKDLNYWKKNAEEDYVKVPNRVLRYIMELESHLSETHKEIEERDRVIKIKDGLIKAIKMTNKELCDDVKKLKARIKELDGVVVTNNVGGICDCIRMNIEDNIICDNKCPKNLPRI